MRRAGVFAGLALGAGILGASAPAAAQCSTWFAPGRALRWAVTNGGAPVNNGTFTVVRFDGNFLELSQRAAGTQFQIEVRFVGGVEGDRFYVANTDPRWPEFWTGACTPAGIFGRVGSFQLRVFQ